MEKLEQIKEVLENLDDESLIELMNIFEGMKDALTEGDE